MNFKNIRSFCALVVSLLIPFCGYAQIKLPKLISDGMVLQHSQNLKIWGWSAPGEKVTLLLNKENYSAKANKKGEWLIMLPAQKAGGPYTMTFTASNKIIVDDILFGDVWLCSGQSNMELGMARLMDTYPEEVSTRNYNIRQFLVPDNANFKGNQNDLPSGRWTAVSPETIADFSGVAYFFASAVYKKHHVPIGIINSALGGSPAQAWISENSLKKFPAYFEESQKFKDDSLIAQIEGDNKSINSAWYTELNKNDEGLKKGWKAAGYEDSSWQEMKIPGYWANTAIGSINGSVWFRKTINVPQGIAGKPAKLVLGRIIDADSVFVNDVFVGTTSYQYPPRKYKIDYDVLKPGKNTIAIRVISNSGKGGFVLDKEYQLISGNDTINLGGDWKLKTGCTMPPIKAQINVRMKASGLYNAMIAPLQNYGIKGALWYQGESNTGNPTEYGDLMKALIADWRAGWKRDFPFIYVQLPGYMEEKPNPAESNWAALREAQRSLLSLKNTAMAVAIDLGEWNDIHPLNKKDVGERLAFQAERLVYGNKDIVASGPSLKKVKKSGNTVTITYSETGGGLTIKGRGPLKYFAIAGADGNYIWAEAKIISCSEIVVSNDTVANPVYVRYAWADNPEGTNLVNKEGLPAVPFQVKL
jgi:sialate O-acetylesterase